MNLNIKDIVFLRSNPVDPDSRVEKEVNTLANAGYNVKIVAWDRENKYFLKESYIQFSANKVKIYRFGIPATFGEGRKNLKAFITFQLRLFNWLIINKNTYQLIHACDFDTAFIAYHCAVLLKKKIIFDVFDYLFTNPIGKHSMFKKFIVRQQHKIINNADGTIICSEKRIKQIDGSKPKKLAVIHNSPQQTDGISSFYKLNKYKVKIAYVGILQDGRLLKELANVVKEMPDCELHIGGFGKYGSYFEKLSSLTQNIIYYGKLPYLHTLNLERNCDIMTAIYDPNNPDHYYAAPNKFYEALMLGKPLIMVKNTCMDEIITQYGLGEIIEYNSESLKKGIENLIERRLEWSRISSIAKQLYTELYDWNEMEKRLIDLYRGI